MNQASISILPATEWLARSGATQAELREQAAALLLRCFPEKFYPLLSASLAEKSAACAALADALVIGQSILARDGDNMAGLLGYFCGGRSFLQLPHNALDAPVRPSQLYIEMLCTASEYRRRGIGRALLSEAARLARRFGCQELALDVHRQNEPALALYRAAGFQISGTRRARPPLAQFVFLRLERPL